MQRYRKEDLFELPVAYKGEEVLLPAKLVQMGYTYKIYVQAEGREIILEPDEERNFRVVIENPDGSTISLDLVKAISEALEKNFR